jgi:hypothetical protein
MAFNRMTLNIMTLTKTTLWYHNAALSFANESITPNVFALFVIMMNVVQPLVVMMNVIQLLSSW